VSKGRNMLAGVSLIVAIAGAAVGAFSFISLNNYINDMDAYINDLNAYMDDMNAYINETNAFINNMNEYVLPMARVYYQGPVYTILSGGIYQLFNYNQKSYDTHEAFDLASDSYTIPETGYYQVIAQYSIDADDGYFYMIQLYSNDILVCSRSSTSSVITNTFGVALADIINFTIGDSITIKVYQYNSGDVSTNIFNGERYTFFAIAKIA